MNKNGGGNDDNKEPPTDDEDEDDDERPFSEFHSRNSRKLLTHTPPDHNGVVECHRCRERFPDRETFYAHASAKLTERAEDIKPPRPGMIGRWVKRHESSRANSFGYFQCCRCTKENGKIKSWLSAYAYKGYGQGCKDCKDKRWINAIFLWEDANPSTFKRRGEKDYSPHKNDLCEACEYNVCKYIRSHRS